MGLPFARGVARSPSGHAGGVAAEWSVWTFLQCVVFAIPVVTLCVATCLGQFAAEEPQSSNTPL